MPFREKIAWVSLGGTLLAFGPYFWAVAHYDGPRGEMPLYNLGLFIAVVVVLTITMTIATVFVAVVSGRDAHAPADERDRGIARRAASIAYRGLLAGLFIALGTAYAGFDKAGVVNAVLGAIVLAEMLRCGLEIVGYRRGWHG